MKLKVKGDKILVKVTREEEVTAGGIIIPNSAGQERKYEGYVVDVGEHPDIEKYGIKTGMYVFYPKGLNTPTFIKEDGVDVEYDVVSVYDVLATGEDE